jgi:hypothetical protein
MIPIITILLPLLPNIVSGIEHLFGYGNGAQKKQVAMAQVSDAVNVYSTLNGGPGADSAMMHFIEAAIEATVAYLNESGKFSHGAK